MTGRKKRQRYAATKAKTAEQAAAGYSKVARIWPGETAQAIRERMQRAYDSAGPNPVQRWQSGLDDPLINLNPTATIADHVDATTASEKVDITFTVDDGRVVLHDPLPDMTDTRRGEIRDQGRRIGSVEPERVDMTLQGAADVSFEPASTATRRGGATLQDDVARYGGKAWDRVFGRWVDIRLVAPGVRCVHFNVDNVLALIAVEPFSEQAEKTYTALGLPLDCVDHETPARDFSQAMYLTFRDAYPRCTAPYPECWLEFSGVTVDNVATRVGVHVVSDTPERSWLGDPDDDIGRAAFRMSGAIYVDDRFDPRKAPVGRGGTGWPTIVVAFTIRLDVDGEVVGLDWDVTSPALLMGERRSGRIRDADEATPFCLTAIRATLLTFSLCNARNIRQVVTREAKAPSRKQARKNKDARPLVEVREIRIDGTKAPAQERVTPTSRRGPVKAHQYRSYWRHYGPKYGTGLLFGRYEALIFQPAGRRGLDALGEVDHTYRVIPRDEAKKPARRDVHTSGGKNGGKAES